MFTTYTSFSINLFDGFFVSENYFQFEFYLKLHDLQSFWDLKDNITLGAEGNTFLEIRSLLCESKAKKIKIKFLAK